MDLISATVSSNNSPPVTLMTADFFFNSWYDDEDYLDPVRHHTRHSALEIIHAMASHKITRSGRRNDGLVHRMRNRHPDHSYYSAPVRARTTFLLS